jgi:excisionase family DNA binding protein
MNSSHGITQLLTREQVADALQFSLAKFYLEVKSGRLKVLRFGRHVRVDPRELQRYIASGVQE